LFKVGLEYVWLWVATIKPGNKQILALSISKERKIFVVAERFISKLVEALGHIQFPQVKVQGIHRRLVDS
jgi:hypothetical protein